MILIQRVLPVVEGLYLYGTVLLCQIDGPADVAVDFVSYRGGLLTATFTVHDHYQGIVFDFLDRIDLKIYVVITLRGFVGNGLPGT